MGGDFCVTGQACSREDAHPKKVLLDAIRVACLEGPESGTGK